MSNFRAFINTHTHTHTHTHSLTLTHSHSLSLTHSLPPLISAGGITKWESVDSGPSIIAPYGTKVGALSRSEPICLDLTQSDDGGQASTSSTATGACDSDHDTWWSQIRAGSLVDAKDLQGVWYQVKQLTAVYPVPVH
jgi:hypothetical protein